MHSSRLSLFWDVPQLCCTTALQIPRFIPRKPCRNSAHLPLPAPMRFHVIVSIFQPMSSKQAQIAGLLINRRICGISALAIRHGICQCMCVITSATVYACACVCVCVLGQNFRSYLSYCLNIFIGGAEFCAGLVRFRLE